MNRAPAIAVLVAALAALLALTTTAAAQDSPKAPSPKSQAKSAFKQLDRLVRGLPGRTINKRNKARLRGSLKTAQRSYTKVPCTSIKRLRAFRRLLKRIREPKNRGVGTTTSKPSRRGVIEGQALRAAAALLQLPRAKKCGGGVRSKVAEADATVLESDERHLRLKMDLPPPSFIGRKVGSQEFQQMFMEGFGETGDVGKPGIPITTEHFGVPNGATVNIQLNKTESYTIDGVNLLPKQNQPLDQAPGEFPAGTPNPPDLTQFMDKPFVLDRNSYNSNTNFPGQAVDGGALGNIRGLAVGGVDFAGGQYQPKSDTLKVFTSIDVTVNFAGDNRGDFGDEHSASPYEVFFNRNFSALLKNNLTIQDKLVRFDRDRFRPFFCGSELLIVTSQELRPAVNTFADGKRAQGYLTKVVEVGAGTGQIGTTPAQIRDFIRNELNRTDCFVHPSYVILFGNTAHVPTFLVPCSPGGDPNACNIASDLDYSLNGIGTDLFADVMLGRIPAASLDAANGVSTKILGYENTPPAPAGDDFYGHAAVTSYFQPPLICVLNEGATGAPNCNGDAPPVTGHWEIDYPANTDTRGFTITAERIRNGIAGDGYTVDRLYTTDDEDVIPLNYWNGTPIPNHLRRPTFAWDANSTDFFNAYNDGRFVILHRDHGWPDGWAEPTLHSGHVPLFTNGTQLPVVFGINCASGAFDNPAHPSFNELQVMRPDGGAFAAFGDTRVSPSFPNNHMALGFFDAMFPLTVNDYGLDPGTRRLGDVLIRGKQYMATQEGFEYHGSGDTYVEHYLYGLLGDPTAQMWAAEPQRFVPPKIRLIWRADLRDILVKFPIDPGDPPPFNTVVTLFQDGAPVGRGIVGQDGEVVIQPDANVDEYKPITASLQQDGVLPAQDEVEERPAPQGTSLTLADPANESFSQTSNGGRIRGKLTPAGIPGAKVRIVYTRTDGGDTFTNTVTPNAQGDFEDTPDLSGDYLKTFKVRAFYDGRREFSPSQSNEVQFFVQGD